MADRFSQLLRARRQFKGVPLSRARSDIASEVIESGDLGRYYPDERLAVWEDGDRATRRHEVMHGIRDIASQDPELAGVLPRWARRGGAFEDELLARLAGGDVRQWNMRAYWSDDPLKYSLAMPVHAAMAHPEGVLAGLVGGGGVITAAALRAKEPQQRIAEEFERQVGR